MNYLPSSTTSVPVPALVPAPAAPVPASAAPVPVPALTPAPPARQHGNAATPTVLNVAVTPVVTPAELRPFSQVVADRTSNRPKRKAGKTRIVTDTPEKNELEDHLRRSKNSEKTRVGRRAGRPSVRQSVCTVPTTRKQTKRSLFGEKENSSTSEKVGSDEDDFDQDFDPLYVRPPSPKKARSTRSGRVVKEKRITSL